MNFSLFPNMLSAHFESIGLFMSYHKICYPGEMKNKAMTSPFSSGALTDLPYVDLFLLIPQHLTFY